MAGGLMQLVAYGAQDVYLTGNPQITLFKVVYRRHTNFSMETIELTFDGNPDFGRRSTVTINRHGDLVTEMYLRLTVDEVVMPPPPIGIACQFAWVRRLGHAIIKSVEVEIGGSRIDKHYGVWLDIWFELARQPDGGSDDRGYLIMIGDVPELTTYSHDNKSPYTMFIPLQFWFNRNYGLALPLIALQYHEVRLHFEFAKAEDVIVADKEFKELAMKQLRIKDALLLVNYIYLDSEERRRFAQVGHEYLIEQLQFTGVESLQDMSNHYKLDFNHPVKEIIWAMKNGNYTNAKSFLYYTHLDDWTKILPDAAELFLRQSIHFGGAPPGFPGTWQQFVPGTPGFTTNGKIYINLDGTFVTNLYINTDSLMINNYSITDKICAVITNRNSFLIKIDITDPGITVRDLSFSTDLIIDTRKTSDNVCINQCHNFGQLVDGSINPITHALIQFNGLDRFDKRNGAYFNYVQPEQHHSNTPKDGINTYSFALFPEQHQPSGTANLSRIDNTKLQLWVNDNSFITGLPKLPMFAENNELFIFSINYNVFRVMSGMAGLAYSN